MRNNKTTKEYKHNYKLQIKILINQKYLTRINKHFTKYYLKNNILSLKEKNEKSMLQCGNLMKFQKM